ncbi:MAG: hypothetical protein SFX73_34360 [Kofleriaceae bacterium]|nr:hypothetical protein [Kofleriaceae bacterium]
MNAKAFLVDALSSALELGLATPDDIVRYVTPDVLAAHLPRPLWARLLTACLGAPRVDAVLIVETLGVPNLGEHIPPSILWACLAEVGARALGGTYVVAPRTDHVPRPAPAAPRPSVASGTPSPPVAAVKPLAIDSPPPPAPPKPARPAPVNPGPSIPTPSSHPLAEIAADIDAELAATSTPSTARTRSPTNRFRPSSTSTNIGRLATRRPQASVSTPEPTVETSVDPAIAAVESPPSPALGPHPADARRVRRGETDAELEVETAVAEAADWAKKLDVEDEQLVDWSGSDDNRLGDDSRKR